MTPDYLAQLIKDARGELDKDARMDAYYYGFVHTGIGAVDAILSEVADAGKADHHTENWSDKYDERYPRNGSTKSARDRIQDAAHNAASIISELVGGLEDTLESLDNLKGLQIDDRNTAIAALAERDDERRKLQEWISEVGELVSHIDEKWRHALTFEEAINLDGQMAGIREVLILMRNQFGDV